MKLIDKDALVAEIESLEDKGKYHEEYDCAFRDGNNSALYALKGRISTLEVKEVDLQSEIDRIWDNTSAAFLEDGWKEFEDIAKHFFELGVNAGNPLTWEDIDLILDITDQIANDDSMEEKLNNMSQEEYCTEVLKRFKAQKGE